LQSFFLHPRHDYNLLHLYHRHHPTVSSILNVPINEKLTKFNYPLWGAQVLPAIGVAQLHDLLTGVETSPSKEIMTMIDD
jgi:hypothetical protein